jgi:hypothetical protein
MSKRNFQPSSPTTLETDVDADKLAKYLAHGLCSKTLQVQPEKNFNVYRQNQMVGNFSEFCRESPEMRTEHPK